MTGTDKTENLKLEKLRRETIQLLEYNYAHGFMEMNNFEKDLETAVHTTKLEVLIEMASELHAIPSASGDSSKSNINTGPVREEETYTGILSGFKRKGKWKPARNNRIFVFMGGIDLDFTEAEFGPGDTEFEFFCVLGGIDIIVPPGINVELSGIPILGGIDNKLSGEHYPNQPTIKIHGIILLGGVDVKPSKKRKRKR